MGSGGCGVAPGQRRASAGGLSREAARLEFDVHIAWRLSRARRFLAVTVCCPFEMNASRPPDVTVSCLPLPSRMGCFNRKRDSLLPHRLVLSFSPMSPRPFAVPNATRRRRALLLSSVLTGCICHAPCSVRDAPPCAERFAERGSSTSTTATSRTDCSALSRS